MIEPGECVSKKFKVSFGFPREFEPLLVVVYDEYGAHMSWGQVPYHPEAERKLGHALERWGLHEWLRSLFESCQDQLPSDSELVGVSFGAWTCCTNEIADVVMAVMEAFIRQQMILIIPTCNGE